MDAKQKERYIKGWKKRIKEKEEKLKNLSNQAMKKAKNISHLLKTKYNVDKVFLFGALAENKFRENSDIDIAIENSNQDEFIEIAKDAYDLAAPYRLDLIPLEKTTASLKKKIKMKGVKL